MVGGCIWIIASALVSSLEFSSRQQRPQARQLEKILETGYINSAGKIAGCIRGAVEGQITSED